MSTIHQPSATVYFLADSLLLLQKGGYEVYAGAIGPNGADVVSFLEASIAASNPQAAPGALRATGCPPGSNPASWQLEVLSLGIKSRTAIEAEGRPGGALTQGSSSAGSEFPPSPAAARAAAVVDTEAPARGTSTVGSQVPEPTLDPAASKPSSAHPIGFVDFTAFYKGSQLYAANKRRLAELSQPDPGSKPVRLESRYARSFTEQLWILLKRTSLAYWRNLPYNATRIIVLTILSVST